MSRKLDFQTMLVDVSERFMSSSTEELDRDIRWALAYIGDAYGIDRISVLSFNSTENLVRRVYQWPPNNGAPTTLLVNAASAPWTFSSIYAGKGFHFSTIADMPAEAKADKRFFKKMGIRSTLNVPVFVANSVAASVSFSMLTRQRAWAEQDRRELGIFVRVVGTAWQKARSQQQLEQRDQDLLRSQRVASLGSFSETALPGQSLIDSFGTVQFSPEACAIFQILPGTETVERALERVHPDDKEFVLGRAKAAFESGSRDSTEYRLVMPDDRQIYIEQRGEVEVDVDGKAICWFGTVQDITERVQARKKLEGALAEIKKLRDQLHDENRYLKSQIKTARSATNIVGNNPRFVSALAAARNVASTDVTVLILGETGTGKELIAREIHAHSLQRDALMVSVNCAALSTELIESELFGHEAGAFTGAFKLRRGRFELAHNGTLFLDEVGDLSLDVQAKILRALQTGEFERLGGASTMKVDVRVIAATNRDLRAMVLNGQFRADLYYRINSFPIEIPALRDRRDDIPLLARYFVERHAQGLGKYIETISEAMLKRMRRKNWAGNVRELESYIQRALISTAGSALDYSDDDELTSPREAFVPPRGIRPVADLDSVQQDHIRHVLDQCDWVIGGQQGAAQILGVPASTLRSRMKRLGIARPH